MPITAETVEAAAKKAVAYAVQFIDEKNSDTHTSFNDRTNEEKQLVNHTIGAQRTASQYNLTIIDTELFSNPSMKVHSSLYPVCGFYARNTFVKTTGCGNCYEYSLLALEYFIKNYPEILVEVFHMEPKGDHVFLVCNRLPGSNPADPKTWGDQCFICDPWKKKVYLASEYLLHLENFIRTYHIDFATIQPFSLNKTEAFTHDKHDLAPVPYMDSVTIQTVNSLSAIKADMQKIIEHYNNIAETMSATQENLTALCLLLNPKDPLQARQQTILCEKTVLLQHCITLLNVKATAADIEKQLEQLDKLTNENNNELNYADYLTNPLRNLLHYTLRCVWLIMHLPEGTIIQKDTIDKDAQINYNIFATLKNFHAEIASILASIPTYWKAEQHSATGSTKTVTINAGIALSQKLVGDSLTLLLLLYPSSLNRRLDLV